ncbi:hypothetical protein LOK49_LG01G00200 [Camellia lanceoleosa]|uniref:Uncharacterized protein n=1 Tax=Camellia lanceoleosa TaxID=1840588 RepID=A0ACC0J4I3_9ERIC|nr:hypothetical protein LOK49_LG01G00200 [Camellia lanceoleosa]
MGSFHQGKDTSVLSSKQSSFQCPTSLSVDAGKHVFSDGDHNGGCSTHSAHLVEEKLSGSFSMNLWICTDKEHVEQTSQQPATAPETLDVRHEGVGSSVADPSFSMGKSPPQNGIYAFDKTSGAGGLGEGTPKSERSDDMFCDDIFGESPAGVRKTGKGDGLTIERSGLHDNWDDAEGYYK